MILIFDLDQIFGDLLQPWGEPLPLARSFSVVVPETNEAPADRLTPLAAGRTSGRTAGRENLLVHEI